MEEQLTRSITRTAGKRTVYLVSEFSLANLIVGMSLYCALAAAPRIAAAASIYATGRNTNGQLGDGTLGGERLLPTPAVATSDYVEVRGGGGFSLGRKNDGTVWAWGTNTYQTLGNGSGPSRSTPQQVPGITGAIAVAAGVDHALALTSDGTVWSWGRNNNSQLGDGGAGGGMRGVALPVVNLTNVVAIAAGSSHSLAVRNDGSLCAWGLNTGSQLGYAGPSLSTPRQITELTNVAAVSAGQSHSLALLGDGTVWAWGYNGNGQLGDGTNTSHATPMQVHNLNGIIAISCGFYHNLALAGDGTIWAWGLGGNGQLGCGILPESYLALPVPGLSGITTIAAANYSSFAIDANGSAWCWGSNVYGQLGTGSYNTSIMTPMGVDSLSHFTAVSGGLDHTLFLIDESCAVGPPENVQAIPTTIVCPGEAVQLSATPGDGGDDIEWLCTDCPMSPVGTGSTITVYPSAPTTAYYARTMRTDIGCTGALCTAAPLQINHTPNPVSVVSRRTHGSAGDFDLSLLQYVESRRGGINTVIITFDEPIIAVDGLDVSDVSLSNGTFTSLAISGNQLTIGGIARIWRSYIIQVGFPGIVGLCGYPGIRPLCLRVLEGDANSDGVVNIFDLVTLRNNLNQPVTINNFRSDIVPDGAINIFDLVDVRNEPDGEIVNRCP